jgi:protein-tyrosine phosphatase
MMDPENFSTPSYDEIVNNLYLGSAAALCDNQKFSRIINCTVDIRFPKHHSDCIRIPVEDDPMESKQLLWHMEETYILEKIHDTIRGGKAVLVHCYAGTQRSCAVVACYLIRYHGMKPMDAITYISTKRPEAFEEGVHFLHTILRFYQKLSPIQIPSIHPVSNPSSISSM